MAEPSPTFEVLWDSDRENAIPSHISRWFSVVIDGASKGNQSGMGDRDSTPDVGSFLLEGGGYEEIQSV